MSLIYNIFLLIGMNKKVKQYVVSNYFKSFNSDNVFIRLVCLLFILAAVIICLYLLYRAISNALYMYRLKTDFYKLQEMGLDVKNYNVLYSKELEKKYIMNTKKILKKPKGDFKNKNAIGFISNKYIVVDIDYKDYDIGNPDFLIEKIPKDTVSEKTPNGYHYYFENDTGNPIHTYVQITIDKVKYSLDVMGFDALITMSPSRVNGKDYYWINSIFTHTPAKLSENLWILDLIKDEKPFFKRFNEMSINIKNALLIINNIYIQDKFITYLKTNEYSKKFKYLNGTVYNYNDNYYFLTDNSFSKYKNKKSLVEKLKNIITELKPSCIIDLSIIYSNYLKDDSIVQLKSSVINNDFKNYKNDREFPNYIETNSLYKKTKYLIEDTITINDYDIKTLTDDLQKQDHAYVNKNNKILFGSESIYITILLSNYFNIPSLCFSAVCNINSFVKPDEKLVIGKKDGKLSNNIITSFLSLF